MPRLDRVPIDFPHIRLLGKRCTSPDAFGRVRLERGRERTLWAERIRTSLDHDHAMIAFANNRFQGHGPATAGALLAEVTGASPET
jgi:hypothetical protein